MASNTTPTKARHALVLGGGITGLASAVALSDHFEAVTVIEQGQYEAEPSVRKHVLQGNHAHILLASGLEVLQRLVPQLPAWLDDMGLPQCDLTRDIRFCYNGQWLPQVGTGIPFRACSRPVVEHLLLRAARARNVEVRTGCTTAALLGRGPVTGARIVNESGDEELVHADFTVLALGRGAKVVEWIEDLLGHPVPVETVDPGLTYTSCMFEAPKESPDWTVLVDVSRYPSQPSTAVIIKVSPTEWLASWARYGRIPSPKTTDELIERFTEVSSETLAEQLRRARPIGSLHSYGNTANRRRRFGTAKRWPERVVVVGDTVCSLNPRYGQGMTVGLLGIQPLIERLELYRAERRDLDGLAASFQRALDKISMVPWTIALMEDQLWAANLEGRPLDLLDRLLMRCSQRALETAFTDMDTYQRFMRVAHMLESPLHLATPKTVAKIAFPQLRRVG